MFLMRFFKENERVVDHLLDTKSLTYHKIMIP